jgi:hypothetical protein
LGRDDGAGQQQLGVGQGHDPNPRHRSGQVGRLGDQQAQPLFGETKEVLNPETKQLNRVAVTVFLDHGHVTRMLPLTRILHIHLLGDFRLIYGDTLLTTVNMSRLQSLLAYLVLQRHAPQSRHYLAFLLWPDTPEAQAHTNLRTLLHRLRLALPEADRFLQADAQTVRWRSDAPFTLDVADFEQALKQANSITTLQQANVPTAAKRGSLYAAPESNCQNCRQVV